MPLSVAELHPVLHDLFVDTAVAVDDVDEPDDVLRVHGRAPPGTRLAEGRTRPNSKSPDNERGGGVPAS